MLFWNEIGLLPSFPTPLAFAQIDKSKPLSTHSLGLLSCRFFFRSGNIEHPEDKLFNTTVEVLPFDSLQSDKEALQEGRGAPPKYHRTSDGYIQIGSFSNGIVEGEVDPAFGPLEAIRLSIQTDSPVWVILSEIFIKKAEWAVAWSRRELHEVDSRLPSPFWPYLPPQCCFLLSPSPSCSTATKAARHTLGLHSRTLLQLHNKRKCVVKQYIKSQGDNGVEDTVTLDRSEDHAHSENGHPQYRRYCTTIWGLSELHTKGEGHETSHASVWVKRVLPLTYNIYIC